MRVSDIRPDALIAGMLEAQKNDIELLKSWSNDFVEIDCPTCSHVERSFLYCYNAMQFQRCSACGMQYISPRPTPRQLADFYARSENYRYWAKNIYPASEDIRRKEIFGPRARLVAGLCRQRDAGGGKLVEVGPGYGLFLEELAKTDVFEKLIGIEPSSELAEICRHRSLEIIELPYEQVGPGLQADVIASFEVIEHLFDPLAFAAWIHSSLRSGGLAILTCPNIEGLDMLMLGCEASGVDHQHLNYFSPQTFRRLLKRAGFDAIEIRTPGLLDVDLLRRAWREGKISDTQIGPFLLKIMRDADQELDCRFQEFLQSALLSSNMMAIASKK